jgi:hypothetical protein
MPLFHPNDLQLNVDQVLQALGTEPEVISRRNDRLVEVTRRAIEVGQPLLSPRVLYYQFAVETRQHERVCLAGGGSLEGKAIAQHLASASQVIVALCTIGGELERLADDMMAENPVNGVALDGVGTAAVEALANLFCNQTASQAKVSGLQTTLPLSPGVEGWPVEQGQPQIFQLIDADRIGVSLTSGYMMVPRKSLTMVIGSGENVRSNESPCDLCNLRDRCQYRSRYASVTQ